MKKALTLLIIIAIISGCNWQGEQQEIPCFEQDTTDKTNDFFDNEPFHKLPVKEIFIGGEIKNPGNVDFSHLPVHSLIVKETLIDGDSNKFIGAYRYDGYSLYDILNTRILEKKNRDDFPPIIDLYIEIENDTGEKALFSWGEIYYPNIRHQIIVATSVLMIKPSKTKNEWPLPEVGKIVVGSDLLTERNISNPVKITVRSSDMSFAITTREGAYSPEIIISADGISLENISELADDQNIITYPIIFYGRGRGIHSVIPFKGVMLKNILSNYFSMNKTSIREGLFVVAAQDGYRAVYTFSEIMNRSDQSEVLVVDMGEGVENGRFRLFPAADFFSDRAIFAVEGIYFE
jgi:hypothetical protein